ncbi:MAG: site-specific integrase [Dokdonella sp.]|nr:site-specific integrase [Dokdonella sp.]
MATKRERNNRWHYVIRRGELLPKPVYLSFPTEREGDEYVARLEALLDRGIVPDEVKDGPKKRPRLLIEATREYLARQHVSEVDREQLRLAAEHLPPGIELRALTFAWASEWTTSLKRRHNLAPSTIRHRVGALARCLDWIAAHADIPTNPLRLLPKGYSIYTPEDSRVVLAADGVVKLSQERDRRLWEGEEERIRAILAGERPKGRQRPLELHEAPSLVLLFDLALESAMRLREMFTLTWDQVDVSRRTVFLDKTKNGDRRQVPLSSVAVRLLGMRAGRAGQVFPWWDGSDNRKSLGRTTSLLSRQFARIFSAARCMDLHFHDLRHEATSRLFERTTLDAIEIAKITGHRSPRSLMRYANLRASTLAERMW